MENVVLTIGGLIKTFDWSDILLFLVGIAIILLLIFVVYLIGKQEEPSKMDTEKSENSNVQDIKNIINNLETNYEAKPIDLSEYEQEMENTAIISYEELLERTNTNITYDDSFDIGTKDIVVKKVDPTNTSLTKEVVELPKVTLMNYESEEAFLKALKKLQSNLVR